jgi:choline dehydrogenase
MQYMRGHPKDYDEWSELGGDGWTYEDVLPYFKKSQRYHESDDFDETYHGADGPMGVRKLPAYSCKMSTLMEKSLNDTLGLEKGDCNGKNQNVIWQSQFNQNSGRRADSYSCFAAPYVGKGLTVLTFAHATKLIMSDDLTAKGVEVERFGNKLELFAKNEVIVSAGAIGSPQLLMLSGT